MSVNSIGSVGASYQPPVRESKPDSDEATESQAVKAREALTGQNLPAQNASSSGKAVDVKA